MKAELEKSYALVDQIEIAMMTTRRPDGHLESRAMATQKRAAGADLWFVAADRTPVADRSIGRKRGFSISAQCLQAAHVLRPSGLPARGGSVPYLSAGFKALKTPAAAAPARKLAAR